MRYNLLAGIAAAAIVAGAGTQALAGTIDLAVKNSTASTVGIQSQGDPSGVMNEAWDDLIFSGNTGPAQATIGVASRTAYVYYSVNPSDYLNAKTCYFRWETNSNGYSCTFKLTYYPVGNGGAQCSGTILSSNAFNCSMSARFEIK
jgi:hypothetical protein